MWLNCYLPYNLSEYLTSQVSCLIRHCWSNAGVSHILVSILVSIRFHEYSKDLVRELNKSVSSGRFAWLLSNLISDLISDFYPSWFVTDQSQLYLILTQARYLILRHYGLIGRSVKQNGVSV